MSNVILLRHINLYKLTWATAVISKYVAEPLPCCTTLLQTLDLANLQDSTYQYVFKSRSEKSMHPHQLASGPS